MYIVCFRPKQPKYYNILRCASVLLHIFSYLCTTITTSMTEQQFIQLTRIGENHQVEYKTCTEQISESLYETICSFLNRNRDNLLIGVADNGDIVGVNPDRAVTQKKNIINSIKNQELFLPCPYLTPQILEAEGKIVLYMEIPSGQYFYRYKGHYWDRNGNADIDVNDQSELLIALFERKNPHLFEDRVVDGLTMEGLDPKTFQYCRNIVRSCQPSHPWLQMTNKEILLSSHLASSKGGKLQLKYAALMLFGTEDAIMQHLPRYRFELLFHYFTRY